MRGPQIVLLVVVALLVAAHGKRGGKAVVEEGDEPSRPPQVLQGHDFDALIASDKMWIVLGLGPECKEPCEVAKKTLGQVNHVLDGAASVAVVDIHTEVRVPSSGKTEQLAAALNLTTIPVLLIYHYGPKAFDKPLRVAGESVGVVLGEGVKGFFSAVGSFFPSQAVTVSKSLAADFVGAAAPLDMPRVLLVWPTPKAPIYYGLLSMEFERKALFGISKNGDEDVMDAMNIGDYDDLPLLFVAQRGSNRTRGRLQDLPWQRCPGSAQSYSGCAKWLLPLLHTPVVPSASDPAQFLAACGKKTTAVCVVFVLPRGPEKFRRGLLEDVKAVAGRAYPKFDYEESAGREIAVKPGAVAFVTVNHDDHPDLVEAFGVDDRPAVVAYNPHKQMRAVYEGNFEQEGIRGFILQVADRRVKMHLVRKVGSPLGVPCFQDCIAWDFGNRIMRAGINNEFWM